MRANCSLLVGVLLPARQLLLGIPADRAMDSRYSLPGEEETSVRQPKHRETSVRLRGPDGSCQLPSIYPQLTAPSPPLVDHPPAPLDLGTALFPQAPMCPLVLPASILEVRADITRILFFLVPCEGFWFRCKNAPKNRPPSVAHPSQLRRTRPSLTSPLPRSIVAAGTHGSAYVLGYHRMKKN